MQQPLDGPGEPTGDGRSVRPLRTRLQEARRRLGLPWEALERDYLQSWVLVGITKVPALPDTLVFKGGTALRKCYFGDYRFSEDLDFSALEEIPKGDEMEKLIGESCAIAVRLLDEYAPVEIICERYTEREPHPGGQEAFTVRARFPWHSHTQTRVMIEVTVDERILRPSEKRQVIHEYGEPLNIKVPVYSLEEIVAEKLRALLQQAALFKARGWSRSRARDYYDLWRMFGSYGDRMELADFDMLLREKCAVRAVSFTGPNDFFDERMLVNVEETWEQWLGPLVSDLPTFGTVVGALRPRVAKLVPADST